MKRWTEIGRHKKERKKEGTAIWTDEEKYT